MSQCEKINEHISDVRSAVLREIAVYNSAENRLLFFFLNRLCFAIFTLMRLNLLHAITSVPSSLNSNVLKSYFLSALICLKSKKCWALSSTRYFAQRKMRCCAMKTDLYLKYKYFCD